MKKFGTLTVIALALLAHFAFGEIIDLRSPPNAVLDPLADELDSKGIDVLRRWEDRLLAPRRRPAVTPLQGFISSSEAETARKLWMQDFEGRIHSILVGVKQEQTISSESTGAQPDLAEFQQVWERAPQSRRVFISFSRADAAYALDVKRALENHSFTTFIYLDDAQKTPALTPIEAGHFFATAGHHLVIDTQNARRSSGVWFEKALLGRYRGPMDLDTDTRPRPSPRTAFTCTCNTYRNGILVSSRQIPRGALCGMQVCR